MAVMVVGGWVLFPAFARIAAERERFRAAFLRSLFWICALGFPLGLILFPLGEPLAVLLFGDTWRPAGHATMLLCLFPAANAVFTVALEALKGDGRPELFLRVYVVLGVLTTVLMLSLLPIGLDGIAGALSLASVGGATYALFVFHRVHPISWPRLLGEIWPAALAAALMAGALYPLEHLVVHSDQRAVVLGLLLVFCEAAIGAVLYLALLSLFARGSFAELRGMARTLANKLGHSMRQRAKDGGTSNA
jgi:PST family polysaccharide transporter